jgi:hyperosmotically inducible protein
MGMETRRWFTTDHEAASFRGPSTDAPAANMAHELPLIRLKGWDMRRNNRVFAAVLGALLVLAALGSTPRAETKSTVEQIRKELMQLPYYGVFDFIAFSYDKGTVTLMGYAYQPVLKKDAERAVKRVAGVDQVIDKIEELPVSQTDDEIRWKTYYAIYRDPFLSRYAPGGGMLWGHRHAFGSALHPLGPGAFPGMEPAGDYPIHIIVKNGHVTLLGVVDNEGDKTIAGMKAREVPGTFGVDNALMVEKGHEAAVP